MNHLFKKLSVAVMIFTFVFLYAFSTNQANAAVGTHDIEKTFEFICESRIPIGDMPPQYGPGHFNFKYVIPERVKPGEEFYMENVAIIWKNENISNPLPMDMEYLLQGINFKIASENESNLIQTFYDDTTFTLPVGYVGPFDFAIKPEEGKNIGPFIAGNEGKVILKANEIRLNSSADLIELKLTLGLSCKAPENEELIMGTVSIDQPPVLTLKGDNPMIVKQGDPYEELGATAEDDFDGDLTDKIEISGDVDTDTIGTYTVTYTVTDSIGNVTTVERTVNVVEPFGDFYSGEGPPSDSLGSNGDTYLDVTTGDVYKRDPNTWTKVGNIKGDDGKQGAKILTGEGAPQADVGNVGDLYFDTKTGDVYEKTADGWVKIANLQGPAGPQGPKGADGAGGTSGDGTGKKGDDTSKVTAKSGGDGKGTDAKGGKLPKTATSLPTLILFGAMLVVAGTILFIRRRKVME